MIPAMRSIICLLMAVVLAGCAGTGLRIDTPQESPILASGCLDHRITPAAAEDWSVMPFADQGAWFGFGLPGGAESGFTGPFLMTSGRWLASQLARLEVAPADSVASSSRPGILEQRSLHPGLLVTRELWFATSKVALLRVTLTNTSETTRTVTPAWVGSVFPDQATLAPVADGIVARAVNGDQVVVSTDRPLGALTVDDHAYRWSLRDPLILSPDESETLGLALTMTVAGDTPADGAPLLAELPVMKRRNRARWLRYHRSAVGPDQADTPHDVVAMKAVQTLINNWRGPAGRFQHGGLFPSSNVWYFNGFWAWDSWKHAVGLAVFDPAIAADQLRLMAAHQDDQGMFADVVYLDPAEDNWRDTKPPLLGWALEAVFAAGHDTTLVRDLYPRAVAFHEFWSRHRDHDQDGLCEYGSTDGTVVAARWESGMDNAVRFDHTTMVQNGPRAWSMNQESVDLNSYLYRDKLALARLAAAAGRALEADRWTGEAERLGELIRTTMFNADTGWFHDIDLATGEFIANEGPEGWIPLWAGVASTEQAAAVRAGLVDPNRFATPVPCPTVSRQDPEFSDGYWRGLVWLDQVYFALEGLRAYGYEDDACRLTQQLLANLEGVAEPGVPLRENYHPLTGEGRNVKHFSWTAAHLLLLLQSQR